MVNLTKYDEKDNNTITPVLAFGSTLSVTDGGIFLSTGLIE